MYIYNYTYDLHMKSLLGDITFFSSPVTVVILAEHSMEDTLPSHWHSSDWQAVSSTDAQKHLGFAATQQKTNGAVRDCIEWNSSVCFFWETGIVSNSWYQSISDSWYQSISDSIYTCMMYDCNIAINIYSSRCANGLSERSLGKNLPMTYGRVVWSMLGIMIITLW